MKLTNKLGYPSEIIKSIEADSYSRGDSEFSATGLIAPARIRVLTEKYKDELETDVDDEIFKLIGHVGHSILERAGVSLGQTLVEKRFFGVVDGTKISAQIDSLSLDEDGVLKDWKFTSVYGFKLNQKPKPEYTAQLNIQLALLRMNRMDAKRLQVVGIMRDWRPSEAKRDKYYPNKIAVQELPMWSREETLLYISKRIDAHRAAEKVLPLCIEDEHWSYRRCAGYCQVSKWCSQYQNKLELESVDAV